MKVLLVSSGIGVWPNDGWGAIENHTADLAWALEKEGIQVKVFHKENVIDNLILVVREWKPDLVHVQYDDHVVALIPILREFPSIRCLVTTQYAYISQPYKLVQDGYMLRFLLLCDLVNLQNMNMAMVSQEVANSYHLLGNVPKDKFWIFPNGSRVDQIQFFEKPVYPMRALCVGKIETRKNQARLQACKCVDFIGPITDDTFKVNEQYKGKWNRKELYENMGKYPCLVLISKGEAHPLVIGEALGAGLSIVCNSVAAANLPKDKPWIRLVEESILDTPEELNTILESMCKIGIEFRSEIRKWAEENIDYRVRAKQYCEKWNLIPTVEEKKIDLTVPSLPDCNIQFITLNDIGSRTYIPQGGSWWH